MGLGCVVRHTTQTNARRGWRKGQMNTFRITVDVKGRMKHPKAMAKKVREALKQAGISIEVHEQQGELLDVFRTNYIVGDVVFEVWAHQGEDGWGIVGEFRDEMLACYERSKWGPQAHFKRIVVTEAWLQERMNDE